MNICQYVRHFDDVITVEYADLVLHPQDVQKRLTDFIGWKVHRPFEQFHTAVPANFRTTALNGLRRWMLALSTGGNTPGTATASVTCCRRCPSCLPA